MTGRVRTFASFALLFTQRLPSLACGRSQQKGALAANDIGHGQKGRGKGALSSEAGRGDGRRCSSPMGELRSWKAQCRLRDGTGKTKAGKGVIWVSRMQMHGVRCGIGWQGVRSELVNAADIHPAAQSWQVYI